MSDFQTNLVHRLELEQRYVSVADVDEGHSALPNEDEWLETLLTEEDDDRYEQLLTAYGDAVDRWQADWTAVGDPFPSASVRGAADELVAGALLAMPPLRALKPHVSRILFKFSPMVCKVLLLLDSHGAGQELTRSRLDEIGKELQAYLEGDDPKAESLKKKRLRMSIQFEILKTGPGSDNAANRRLLKSLHRRFSPKRRIFVQGFILDTATRQVWGSTARLFWPRRRYFRHALRHQEQTQDHIRSEVESHGVSSGLVLLGAFLAMAFFFAGRATLNAFGLEGEARLRGFVDFAAPLLALAFTIPVPRLRLMAGEQAKYTLLAYLTLYWGIHFIAVWPPGGWMLLNLLIVTVMAWIFGRLVGELAAAE
ncbi:hypothetical protein QQM79_19915 [Marinobacteraceae bacterium S3BR75-40.1]